MTDLSAGGFPHATYVGKDTTVADVADRVAALEAENSMLREALEGLAGVMERDCGVYPCIRSMAPAEHYLGRAKAALKKTSK